MDSWWNGLSIEQLIDRLMRVDLMCWLSRDWYTTWNIIKARTLNLQTPDRACLVGKKHYDIGNDLYLKMLDRRKSILVATGKMQTAWMPPRRPSFG